MAQRTDQQLARDLLPHILKKMPKQKVTRSSSDGTVSIASSGGTGSSGPEYSITDLGVVGNGSTADDKLFQTALDAVGAAGGGYIWAEAPGGAFVLGSRMQVPSNTTLHFLSPVKFKAKGGLAFFGEVEATPEFTKPRLRADAAEGTFQLQLGALSTDDYHNFHVGDKITLRGMSDGAGQATQKQITFVTAINTSTNTLTIRDELDFTFMAVYPAAEYEANFGIVDRTYIQIVTFSKFAADVTEGTSTFTVLDASKFHVGDYVELSDDTLIQDMYPVATYPLSRSLNQFRIETARVKAVNTTSNTVTIDRNCYHNFVAANGGGITKLLVTQNSHILNAHAVYIEDSPTRNYHSFQARMSVHCTFRDCSVTGDANFGGRGHGFRLDQSLSCIVDRCAVVDPKFFESAEGYGVTLYAATHCVVSNCYMSNCRHSVLFFKGSCGNIVQGCRSVGCRISDFDMHGGNAKYNLIDGNYCIGGPNGTPDSTNKSALKVGNTTHAVGDHYNTFSNNMIVDYPGPAYIAGGGTGAGIEIVPAASHNVFKNNTFINTYRGIYTKSSTRFWDVRQYGNSFEDNTFDGCSLELIYCGGDADGYVTINDLVIRGNRVMRCTRFWIIDGCAGVHIANNMLENPNTPEDATNKYAVSVSDATGVVVIDNTWIGLPRGVKLTNCPAAVVATNRMVSQTNTIAFQDAGGNTGYLFHRNEYINFTNTYSGIGTSTGTIVEVGTGGGGGGTIGGGATNTQIAYGTGVNTIGSEANLVWDATNHRMGIGVTAPTVPLHVKGASGASVLIDNTATTSYSVVSLKTDSRTYELASGGTATGALAGAFYVYDELATAVRMLITATGSFLLSKTSGLTGAGDIDTDGTVKAGIVKVDNATDSYDLVLTSTGIQAHLSGGGGNSALLVNPAGGSLLVGLSSGLSGNGDVDILGRFRTSAQLEMQESAGANPSSNDHAALWVKSSGTGNQVWARTRTSSSTWLDTQIAPRSQALFSVNKGGTDQTGLTVGGFTKITWSSESYDTLSAFASSTFTAPVAGVMMFTCSVLLLSTLQDLHQVIFSLYKNGARYKETRLNTSGTNYQSPPTLAVMDLAAVSDTYEIYIYHDCTVTQGVYGGAAETHWEGSLISFS